MRKGLIFFYLFSLSLSAAAQSGGERTATGGSGGASSPAAAPTPAAQPWQTCVRSLCGEELGKSQRRMFQMYADLKKFEEVSKKYKSLLDALNNSIRSELKEEKERWQEMLKYLREGRKISDPIVLKFLDKMTAAEKFKHLSFDEQGQLDKKKTHDLMLADGLNPRQVTEAINYAEQIIELGKKVPEVLSEDFIYLSQKLKPEEIKKQLQDVVSRVDELRKRILTETSIPEDLLFSDRQRWAGIKEKLSEGEITPLLVEQISEARSSTEIFPWVFAKDEISRPSISLREAISKEEEQRIGLRIAAIDDFLGPSPKPDNPISAKADEARRNCLVVAGMMDEFFPSKKQIRDFAGTEKKWRKEFLEKTSKHLSQSSQKELNSFFSGLRFKPAESQEEWKTKVELAIDKMNEGADFHKLKNNALIQQFLMGTHFHELKSEKGIEVLDEDTLKVCQEDGGSPNPWTDHVFWNQDKVHLGAQTICHPEDSQSTAFHEYGHILDGFINASGKGSTETKAWIADRKTCLAKGHSQNGETHSREDFADLLGGGLSDGLKERKYFCGFLDDIDSAGFSLKASEGAVHSTNLYRAMHHTILGKGKIPEVCTQALKAKGEEITISHCLP